MSEAGAADEGQPRDEGRPRGEADSPAAGFGDHFRHHARGLSAVALASALGIAASFLYQVLSARYLAPADFGLLSAFFVIVNTAAIGSSSLQNIVVVNTAEALAYGGPAAGSRRRWPLEAIVIGLVGGLAVAICSPWLASSLDTSWFVVLAAAATIPLSFVLADTLGLLQGSGNVTGAVWWSTAAQLSRLALLVAAVAVGAGLAGAIGAVVGATVVVLAGTLWSARRIPRPATGVLSVSGLTIVALTTAFAWLTNADVFYLRAWAPDALAGTYASAAVLVKAGFLVPATLSLYLLPRFVRNRHDVRLSRLGAIVTLSISLATGIAMVIVFALLGSWLIALLYGPAYAGAAAMLVPIALAYLPWMAAQGLLIKLTSSASRAGAVLLLFAVAAQWIVFSATIPDLPAMLWGFGAIGTVVLLFFVAIEWLAPLGRGARRSRGRERDGRGRPETGQAGTGPGTA
jgi:O-antigen/teichoic acid export membrane protein